MSFFFNPVLSVLTQLKSPSLHQRYPSPPPVADSFKQNLGYWQTTQCLVVWTNMTASVFVTMETDDDGAKRERRSPGFNAVNACAHALAGRRWRISDMSTIFSKAIWWNCSHNFRFHLEKKKEKMLKSVWRIKRDLKRRRKYQINGSKTYRMTMKRICDVAHQMFHWPIFVWYKWTKRRKQIDKQEKRGEITRVK